MLKKYIIANWKMNLNLAETLSLAKKFKEKFAGFNQGEVVVCPSTLFLIEVNEILKGSIIKLGAQNVFWEEVGASYTGEVSPEMLAEAGCRYVILGHSERRKYLSENYEIINKKVRAVVKNEKLIPIVCIGESLKERKTDRRDFVLVEQLEQALSGIEVFGDQRIIIAYEPIWAIGTSTALEPAEAEYAHKIIKLALNDIVGMQAVSKNFSVIYGGSINSKNVKSFANLEDIDGLLVGGASLKIEEFYKVAKSIVK
ncbi:triose-phosphate isomerase [Patescibacteria group bacterium]|nr:triose-phosphate isomerase [Patescibacteria group bacterium]MBU1663127.1 triose-phosphate isomerase [Patescibacteria group bacterium]MBU1933714.1 triose-phosphate isomerase [Patescibacteria group bacterium]MBU2008026.1 triose-phosphate isomerase [Patescibacteria group bacterium]MBU2233711.1 triose-phosphate isomerase [Patescibacteria group bacterium]